jgi:hypothetical protein
MKMKLLTADGTTEIGNWPENLERPLARGFVVRRNGRRQDDSFCPSAVAQTQVGSRATSLLSLRATMRQEVRKEFWITTVLWVASWGAVALLFV